MKAVHASHIKNTHQSLILTFLTLTHTDRDTQAKLAADCLIKGCRIFSRDHTLWKISSYRLKSKWV